MANRRMISKHVIQKDKFLQMPVGAQCLYFHLCLNADDEGFVDNAISLMSQLPVNFDDLKVLLAKEYVLLVEDSLYVITHWKINNRVDLHHYTGTLYVDALKKLRITDNKSYSMIDGESAYEYVVNKGYNPTGEKPKKKAIIEPKMSTKRVPNENILDSEGTQNVPQLSKVKLSKVKVSKDKVSKVIEDEQTVSSFISAHEELKSLDERFVLKLESYLEITHTDKENFVPYCTFVYEHISNSYPIVTAQLFYKLCFEDDIFYKFTESSKYISHPKLWTEPCPVCGEYHNSLGTSENCTLDMSQPYNDEDIQDARNFFNLSDKEKLEYRSNLLKKLNGFITNGNGVSNA